MARNKRYRCPTCGKQFKDRKLLDKHMGDGHLPPGTVRARSEAEFSRWLDKAAEQRSSG